MLSLFLEKETTIIKVVIHILSSRYQYQIKLLVLKTTLKYDWLFMVLHFVLQFQRLEA